MTQRRAWGAVLAAAVVLGLVALASNITTDSQVTGQADAFKAARWTVSKVVNAGAVWAGLLVLSGWLVRRPVQAAAAGLVAGFVALVAHYGAGQLVGVYDVSAWADNATWFLAAAAVGGPLGLVGAAARRHDAWGLAARLVVPVGALLEPLALGSFVVPTYLPWPDRAASAVSGTALVAAGAAGVVAVIARKRR